MGISGRDLAILSARFGVARFGASRFGFCPDDIEGSGKDEPGEYVWKEHKLAETTWTLQSQCEGNVCGWKTRASFTATPASGTEPLTVVFADTSTPAHDIDSWAWSFGDGNSSTSQNPTHVFSADGTYTVTLTVTNSKGSSTATGTVTVTPALGSISGTVTYSGDGGADFAWPGVTVTLYKDDSPVDTTVADASGFYEFTDLVSGAYYPYAGGESPYMGLPQAGVGEMSDIDGNDVTVDVRCAGGG